MKQISKKKIDGFKSHNIIRLGAERMGLLSCFFGDSPSKWLTNRERLLIITILFLQILALIQKKGKINGYCFYTNMYAFVSLANEYLLQWKDLTSSQKGDYQRRLHSILKRLLINQNEVIGGTFGQSWCLLKLFCFYETVKRVIVQKPFPGEIPYVYCLPFFNFSSPKNPLSGQEIREKIQKMTSDLPSDICKNFPGIFHSSQALNVPLPIPIPIVSPVTPRTVKKATGYPDILYPVIRKPESAPPSATPFATLPVTPVPTPLATPRSHPVDELMHFTPAPTSRSYISQPSTPRTQELQNNSKWLLYELFKEEFLLFLKEKSDQSSSRELTLIYKIIQMYFTKYVYQLLIFQNPVTINSFFQALNEYQLVKIALELYNGKPLDGWMDIRIVCESNEEKQFLFFQYLKMLIELKAWLHNPTEETFERECAGKLYVFDVQRLLFDIFDLPEEGLTEQLPAA
jgi:hypothetical protein